MNIHTTTHYILSHPSRSWDSDNKYETRAEAHNDMLKIQVRQKEKGLTPEALIIVKVEQTRVTDEDGAFISSTTTETRA